MAGDPIGVLIDDLTDSLKSRGSVLVAFSGGVDSSVVAALAYRALNGEALAVTAASETLASRELEEAGSIAREIGIRHQVITFSELADEDFARNPSHRCYFCQRMRMGRLRELADQRGFHAVAAGTNLSEVSGHRPGIQAMTEHSIYQPLLEHRVDKSGVRAIARALGLSNWDKPSVACMASRIPHDLRVTRGRLSMIERAEDFLRQKGFKQFRVRHHREIARIEIAREEFDNLLDRKLLREISAHLKQLGFTYVTLDLDGYRSGSLNEAEGLR